MASTFVRTSDDRESEDRLVLRLEALELLLQEPMDIWRIVVAVSSEPSEDLAAGAIEVQEWLRSSFPLVAFEIDEMGEEAWVICCSAYPEDCENLGEEIRACGSSPAAQRRRCCRSSCSSTGRGMLRSQRTLALLGHDRCERFPDRRPAQPQAAAHDPAPASA
jgi:hypothetical protein